MPIQNQPFQLIVLGASLGGAKALGTILSGLPAGFPLPLAVVLHRGPRSDDTLPEYLRNFSLIPVREVEDKEAVRPGQVHLAPADYHLLIEPAGCVLSQNAPEHYARPAIDPLFESAADVYGGHLVGVILTGGNNDGARGLTAIKARGGHTIVQDPATAENPVMPQAAIETGAVDCVLPLPQIAAKLCELAGL